MARIAAERLAKDTTQAQVLALGEVRLGAPVPRPGKIIAVGLNYRDHLMESGAKEVPTSPLIFAKFTTSICGPGDVIVLPASDAKVDYEAELGVVIGKRGKAITAQKAYEYVAGYINYFSTHGRGVFEGAFVRSGRYREMNLRIFKEEGVPQDPVSYTHLTLPTKRIV